MYESGRRLPFGQTNPRPYQANLPSVGLWFSSPSPGLDKHLAKCAREPHRRHSFTAISTLFPHAKRNKTEPSPPSNPLTIRWRLLAFGQHRSSMSITASGASPRFYFIFGDKDGVLDCGADGVIFPRVEEPRSAKAIFA